MGETPCCRLACALWVEVACWEKLAETVNEHVKVGMGIAVMGLLDVRAYKSDKDGALRASVKVTASRLEWFGAGKQGAGTAESELVGAVEPEPSLGPVAEPEPDPAFAG